MACINCMCSSCLSRPTDDFDPVADVEAFHKKYGLEYVGRPRVLENELAEFRRKFLKEEYKEYSEHMYQAIYYLALRQSDKLPEHLEGMLDALVDLVYVALGNAYMHGFNFREAWRRVHDANMKKERATRLADTRRGSLYDVVKPAGWRAPSHFDLVVNHAHQGDDNGTPPTT